MNWRGSYIPEKTTSYGTFGSNPLKTMQEMGAFSLPNAGEI